MRVNCLGCGHMINLGHDYANYKGPVRCNVCRTISFIEAENGKIKTMRPVDEELCETCESGDSEKGSSK